MSGGEESREGKPGVAGNKCEALPPFTGGLRESRRGVGTRQEMEEIRGNTAELDKPARRRFVLSGVRNVNEPRASAWHRVVGGHRPRRDHRVSQRTSSSPLRLPVYAEIGNLLTRDSRSRR